MASPMASQTAQGIVLSITSNLIAQVISSYKDNTALSLNFEQTLRFAIFSLVSNPPNIIWQNYIESLFPTNVPATPSSKDEKFKDKPVATRLSKTNVLIKFILDQTFGAVVNNLMFLVFMAYANRQPTSDQGAALKAVVGEVRHKLYPMMLDGYKFWPAVSLVSFLWVPVDKRVVFGCLVGMVWNIYLSLLVDS